MLLLFYILSKTKALSMKKLFQSTLVLAAALAFHSCSNTETGNNAANRNVAPYTLEQQIFCHNTLSNISSYYNKSDQQAQQDSTAHAVNAVLGDKAVQQYLGKWTCVWGPVVINYKEKAMNTMYIAQSQDTPGNFVVAIAGTDAQSIMDWLKFDFNILTMIPWLYPVGIDVGMISTGTNMGLNNLKGMTDNSRGGIDAETFLSNEASKLKEGHKMNIWVTGHSLGGALAPVFALYLHHKKDKDKWPNVNDVTVNCIALAGATPGNKMFSDYYNKQMGSNTIRIWNTMDVVPHGYEIDMLNELPNLYTADSISMDSMEFYTVTRMTKYLDSMGYNYTQLFPGTVVGFTSGFYSWADTLYNPSDTSAHPKKRFDPHTYLGQLGCMHIPAYASYYKAQDFQVDVQRILGMNYPFFSEGFKPQPVTPTFDNR